MNSLAGKTALITGASRGIGRELAVNFAKAGANLFLPYNKTSMDGTLKDVSEHGVKAETMQAGLSDPEGAGATVKECMARFGSIDILVNNAGITRDALLMRMKDADWDDVLNTNLKGAFMMMRAVTRPMMKQRSGKIINVGSVVGATGNPGQANYAASKAGLIGLTKSVARELGSRGITVNLIAPGYIITDMTDALDDKSKKAITDNIPLGRLGTTSDVAEAALFLASPSASYITGHVLHVNGGLYM